MKRATALTHADFEGPSRIGPLLAELGYELEVLRLHRGDRVPSSDAAGDLVVVMGGPMGVPDVDDAKYPYLRAEVELMRRRLERDQAVVGVCLGAQLLAHAAGAKVYPMVDAGGARRLELGWGPVALHVRNDRMIDGLPSELTVLHWHGDTFDVPESAVLLASSAACPNQAFRIRSRLFGLQFHCEVTAHDVEVFLREDHDFAIRAIGEEGVARLREETLRRGDDYREGGERLLRRILRTATA